MSGGVAPRDRTSPRLLVVDRGTSHDVFELLGLAGGIARVRSTYLFEVGEELAVRVEQDGKVSEAVARVRAHAGAGESRVTELELTEQSAPRSVVSG